MLVSISDRVIEYSFYLLFLIVPLIITPMNYELFEYNKMMFTYSLTIIIVSAWLTKMVANRRILIQRTPFDIPLGLFAISQLLSTIFSMDPHVSIWGYYSRFHGGLLSTITYLLLYYAAVSNLDKIKVLRVLSFGLLGGALVGAYGVAEHFGIDAQYWVQDVRNRVFSTLGQPNWLAAYVAILIPIAIALSLNHKFKALNSKQAQNPNDQKLKNSKHLNFENFNLFRISDFGFWICFFLAPLFYLALLYTKSRSGFLGLWAGNLIFWAILFFKFRKGILKWLLILNATFLILNFLVGSPFEQVNKYFSFAGLQERITHVAHPPSSPPPPGGTESGDIRKIVWNGAIDIWRHYPILGSGVETFAFSYYQYRPVEHNMVSEWDFLYNKAHNEYLNFLATTGAFGLGSYLLLIIWFLSWSIKKISNFKFLISKQIQNPKSKKKLEIGHSLEISNWTLVIALLGAYISILVSNFFGFSVVIVALFFFLIPAFSLIITQKEESTPYTLNPKPYTLNHMQSALMIVILFAMCYLLFTISRLWLADVHFAQGYNLDRVENYTEAYAPLKQAIGLNPKEPVYRDELANTSAALAVLAAQDKNATEAAKLARESIEENIKTLEVSPKNVNFWKSRTRIFYTLSALNEDYNKNALEAIKIAAQLAPSDAKVFYNLAIMYGRVGDSKMAIKTLEETVKLKPDYRDARYALALYLKTEGKTEEANVHLKYILEKISSEDSQAKELLGQ